MLEKSDIEILRASALFEDVPEKMLDDLVRHGSRRHLDRGETLFVQGDAADCIYIVLKGWMKLSRITPAGKDVVVAIYSAGESFGEAAALKGETYPVTVEAVEDSTVFQIAARTIAERITTNPQLAMAMLASTFRHLHALVLEIEDIKSRKATQRLATFLVALAPQTDEPARFSLPYDKGLIAARLGMKPESLSRSIADLRQQGVTIQRGNVTIDNLDHLRKFIVTDRKPARQTTPPCE